MAKKQYLDLTGLTTYDEQIKAHIAAGDEATSTKLTSGDIVVKEAQHATSADSATNADKASDADKLGGQSPSYYAKASDIPTGALADKNTVSESDLDSALAEKVNAAAEGNHSHSNKTVIDGITAAKVSAWDSAEANAKAYADSAASTAANTVKNDLLNGAGTAYDTLKELGDLIDDNVDAIEALEAVAAGKADAEHDHEITDVTGLQDALDAKAWNQDFSLSSAGLVPAPMVLGGVARTLFLRADGSWEEPPVYTHPNSGVTAGTYKSVTVDTQGHITAGSNPTTLAGYGITDAASQSSLDGVSSVANEAKTAAAANTQSITAHTSSINTHTSQISALQGLVGEGTEAIPTASITALFA